MENKKFSIDSNNRPLSKDEVKNLELWFGEKIPKDYQDFLLSFNGGVPKESYFIWQLRGHKLWVNKLYPFIDINSDEKLLGSICWAHQIFGNFVPQKYLIIGTAVRDDLLMINLNKKDNGSVWMKFWDEVNKSSDEYMELHPDEAVYRLADTFTDFMNSLTAYE